MRLLIGLLLSAALAAGDVAQLHELADSRRIFLLRDALQQPGRNKAEILFYRGPVESRFGQEPKGIDDLSRFLASHPSPDRRRKACEELATALTREGRALTKDEIAGLTAKDEKTAGDLSNVSLLTTAPEGDARYRDGVLGTDALRAGFRLDFRTMQLRFE